MMVTDDDAQAVQAELLSCQTQLDQLSTECMEVCPIYARQSNPANPSTPCAVIAVCDYARNQVTDRYYYASTPIGRRHKAMLLSDV